MKLVKTSDAKNNLSRYLKYVQGGGRVRIFDRNRPVADLVPVDHDSGEMTDKTDAVLADLARRGVVRLGDMGAVPAALLRPGPRLRNVRVRGRRRRVVESGLAALLADRADSR